MRQIGLACHNYNDTYNSLPFARGGTDQIGRRGATPPIWPPITGIRNRETNVEVMSGFVSLANFMEFHQVYDQAQQNNFGPHPNFDRAEYWAFQPPTFLCPSDTYQRRGLGDQSYKFNLGTQVYRNNTAWGRYPENGMFSNIELEDRMTGGRKYLRDGGQTVALGEVTDGLSNTMMISERRNGANAPGWDIAHTARNIRVLNARSRALQNSATKDPYSDSALQELYQICWATANESRGRRYNPNVQTTGGQNINRSRPGGGRWGDGRPYFVGFTTIITPNGPSCSRANVANDGIYTVSSRHPSLVNGVLGDGSTKTIPDTIDRLVWWALGNRAGGENRPHKL